MAKQKRPWSRSRPRPSWRRRQYGNLVRALVHDLGSKDGLGILDKVAGVLRVDLKLVGDLAQARLLMKAWAANSKPSAILGA